MAFTAGTVNVQMHILYPTWPKSVKKYGNSKYKLIFDLQKSASARALIFMELIVAQEIFVKKKKF